MAETGTPTAEQVAAKFSEILRGWLTPEQMEQVVERNRAEKSPGVCHSHDFCDANMFLYDVFMKYGMNPVEEGGMDRWGDLWDRSWNMAKAAEFKID